MAYSFSTVSLGGVRYFRNEPTGQRDKSGNMIACPMLLRTSLVSRMISPAATHASAATAVAAIPWAKPSSADQLDERTGGVPTSERSLSRNDRRNVTRYGSSEPGVRDLKVIRTEPAGSCEEEASTLGDLGKPASRDLDVTEAVDARRVKLYGEAEGEVPVTATRGVGALGIFEGNGIQVEHGLGVMGQNAGESGGLRYMIKVDRRRVDVAGITGQRKWWREVVQEDIQRLDKDRRQTLARLTKAGIVLTVCLALGKWNYWKLSIGHLTGDYL